MSEDDKPLNRFRPLVMTILLSAFASQAATLRLASQTWENLIGGGVVHSPFDYDAKGLRTQRRDYNSADSSGPRIARTVWEYDTDEHMIRQVQFGATDTVSILTQTWVGDNLVRSAVWGKGGIQRYRDTSVYDGSGNEILSKRLSPSDSLVSQQTFTYDNQGQLVADTTWQPQTGSLIAVQATQTHWEQGHVLWTQEWSRSPGSTRWNALQRTDMAWSGVRLASATNLSGDGTGRVLVDSTAYTYDVSGNKSAETTFNAERVASARTTFSWEGTSAARQRLLQTVSDIRWNRNGSSLALEAIQTPLEITLLDANGRVVLRQTGSSRSVDIGKLSQGRYLATATFAHGRSVHPFTALR
ncbi:MAG: hypothetical protein IPN71_19580 [Fibrobacteres bacterium]|nr:hypothetical protein [Fibrobacterota bacterium]